MPLYKLVRSGWDYDESIECLVRAIDEPHARALAAGHCHFEYEHPHLASCERILPNTGSYEVILNYIRHG